MCPVTVRMSFTGNFHCADMTHTHTQYQVNVSKSFISMFYINLYTNVQDTV